MFNPFHVVSGSPWPVLISLGVSASMINTLMLINGVSFWGLKLSMFGVMSVSYMWWRDVVRESTFQGHHTKEVAKGMMVGMLMFIGSEVMFFFSFFFSYFYLSLSPDVEIGTSWPPVGIEMVSVSSVPFLNTLLLLSSGVSVTCSHYYLMSNSGDSKIWVLITVMLGVVFLIMQSVEYFEGKFTMSDSVFGSLFYVMTGFHGLHVIIGVIFIMVSGVRLGSNHMSCSHHLGFELSAWYWHFVDVVWLFLFVWVYWWGS